MTTIADLLMDNWVQAFMQEHQYRPPWIAQDEWEGAWDMTPEEKISTLDFSGYEWSDQQRALEFGQNFARANGRPPNQDEYRWQWFADRGINADTGKPLRGPNNTSWGGASTPFGVR